MRAANHPNIFCQGHPCLRMDKAHVMTSKIGLCHAGQLLSTKSNGSIHSDVRLSSQIASFASLMIDVKECPRAIRDVIPSAGETACHIATAPGSEAS